MKDNCKLRVTYLSEKYNIINSAHYYNGHLGINITLGKIKELGYFWEILIEEEKILLIIVLIIF